MYAKFTCHKCGNVLFVSDRGTDAIRIKDLEEVSDLPCPACGEEGERNWALSGITEEFKEAD